MFGLTDKLIAMAAGVGCLILAGLLLAQTGRLHKAQREADKAQTALAQEQRDRKADQTAVAQAYSKALEDLRTKQDTINTAYQGALNDARTRETSARNDAAAARVESDGLRAQSMSAARRLADAATPAATVREYAVAVNELFDNCQRDYQSMADKAAGHANDVRTLLAAWPVTKPPEIQRTPQQGVGAGSS